MTLMLALAACDDSPVSVEGAPAPAANEDGPTYWRDAEPVLAARCTGCHVEGGIAPFALDTYEAAVPWSALVASAVEGGTMPPWPPAQDCASYEHDRSLPDAERDALLAWVAAGSPEGDPEDAAERAVGTGFVPDLVAELPEAYTPVPDADDYRCFAVPWRGTGTRFVTGLTVLPDQGALVHHVIVSAFAGSMAAGFVAADEADPGAGWACQAGSIGVEVDPAAVLEGEVPELPRMLGGWVPGSEGGGYPEGTGIEMHEGDVVLLQFHYNTMSAPPAPDRSSVGFATAETVARPAAAVFLLDLGWATGLELLGGPMEIPAGASGITHTATFRAEEVALLASSAGLDPREPFRVYGVGTHMHLLGRQSRIEVRGADGEDACLLQIDDWDFHWQGSYTLAAPVVVRPEDELLLSCTFDNSAGAEDVAWGEGTSDEMCLGTVFVTADQ